MLSTSRRRATGGARDAEAGRRWMRSALPGGAGIICARDSDSPLWYGGVGGMYTEVELRLKAPKMDCGRRRMEAEELVRERSVGAEGWTLDVRNGREMVVTSIEFLRRALSEIFSGMKLMNTSNGRWEGSGGGKEVRPRRGKNEPAKEDGLEEEGGEEPRADSAVRKVEELPGEVGVL